jgi:hypothetical protein
MGQSGEVCGGESGVIDISAKSAKENLTDAEKHEIRRLIASFEAEA